MDVAAYSPDFEYWVTALVRSARTVHESEPIDEAVDQLKKKIGLAPASTSGTWDASRNQGTAPDRVA